MDTHLSNHSQPRTQMHSVLLRLIAASRENFHSHRVQNYVVCLVTLPLFELM